MVVVSYVPAKVTEPWLVRARALMAEVGGTLVPAPQMPHPWAYTVGGDVLPAEKARIFRVLDRA